MSIKYVAWPKYPNGSTGPKTKPLSLLDSRDRVVGRLRKHKGSGFQVRSTEEDFTVIRTLEEIHDLYASKMRGIQVGGSFIFRSVEDDFRMVARKVEITPPSVNTEGNDDIDKIYTWLQANFKGQWMNWGICVCKRINHSSSEPWSQHSWCNAIDVGISTMATGDRIYNALNIQRLNGNLPIGTMLWRVPDHYTHIHVQGLHTYTGTPPCAS